jgi:hypothetical protein
MELTNMRPESGHSIHKLIIPLAPRNSSGPKGSAPRCNSAVRRGLQTLGEGPPSFSAAAAAAAIMALKRALSRRRMKSGSTLM